MPLSVPEILCSPDGKKSCGACCGLFNHIDVRHESLQEKLRARTRDWEASVDIHSPKSLRAFRSRWDEQVHELAVPSFHTCSFLGMIDEEQIGCLAHPLRNQGIDGRDCGAFESHEICAGFFCASHSELGGVEKWLVIASVDDSITYSLVITDVAFVRALTRYARQRLGRQPTFEDAKNGQQAAGHYFETKRSWPYRIDDVWLDPSSPEPHRGHDPITLALMCIRSESHGKARHQMQSIMEAFVSGIENG